MVGGRGDGVRAFRHHAGAGYIPYDLGPRQMAADAGLGALSHFDLNGGAGVQIILVDAEPAGGHLDDGVRTVAVEILVKAAFAGVVIDAQGAGAALAKLWWAL